MAKSNIYTKGGDKCETSLIGGSRVAKHHARVEAYGTVDELIAWVGYLRDHDIEPETKKFLIQIQSDLMYVAAMLASDEHLQEKFNLQITELSVENIEKEIDQMDAVLPQLKSFILPGGHQAVSVCNICRTITRRAERCMSRLSEKSTVQPLCTKYINRLSDYFFVLSRFIGYKFKVTDTIWPLK